MIAEFERQTVADSVEFCGKGVHTGEACSARVFPGSDGIAFRVGSERILAMPSSVTDTTRTTRLGPVGMAEHLMSAFAAMEISDAEVEVIGPELPILDGSALDYWNGLQAVGAERTGKTSKVTIFSRVNVQGDNEERIGVSAGSGRWRYEWEVPGCWLGPLGFEASLPDDYGEQIAPAKTFCQESEIAMARAAGLGKGADEHNTLVIGQEGYLTEQRFRDEPPRHKLLDLIGDLMLAGIPPRFLNVVAERSGHRLNVEAAARLAETCTWED